MNEQELARLVATLEHLKHPFDRKQISKLPASDKRPALDYVNHAHVTNRLNQYAPDWSYTVDEIVTENGECWVRGTMTIYGASRVEFGKGKNPLEAMSHFIRRAAMRFGVATDLWAKEDFEDADDSATASKPSRDRGGPSPAPVIQSAATPPAVAEATPTPEEFGEGSEGVEVATKEQWDRLLAVVDNSMARAVNRLNKANHTNYTKTTAMSATHQEVAFAISGGAEW